MRDFLGTLFAVLFVALLTSTAVYCLHWALDFHVYAPIIAIALAVGSIVSIATAIELGSS